MILLLITFRRKLPESVLVFWRVDGLVRLSLLSLIVSDSILIEVDLEVFCFSLSHKHSYLIFFHKFYFVSWSLILTQQAVIFFRLHLLSIAVSTLLKWLVSKESQLKCLTNFVVVLAFHIKYTYNILFCIGIYMTTCRIINGLGVFLRWGEIPS